MQRALRIANDPPAPQVSRESDAMRRWTERQREQQLAARLDRLTTVLEQLVAVLARRAA
jgi:hypothetical protein